MKTNPGPQKVGVITGLDLAADTLRMKKALEELRQQYPQFQVVDVQSTDYTIPDAQKDAQNMLQTHPDIGIIVTNWYTITRGSLSAIDQAGKSGKIKLYDFGGTAWSRKAIEAGQVVATVPIYGYTATAVPSAIWPSPIRVRKSHAIFQTTARPPTRRLSSTNPISISSHPVGFVSQGEGGSGSPMGWSTSSGW